MLRDLPPFAHDEGPHLFMTGLGILDENEPRNDSLDDVFGSAPASPTLAGSNDSNALEAAGLCTTASSTRDHSDFHRLRSTHRTNGYREGIAASKELHMQEGFDEGYSLGAELGLKVGWCLGALEGIWRALRANILQSAGDGAASGDESYGGVEVGVMLETARRELEISQLCARDYFGEDGLWLYGVPGQEDEEHEMTFERVASAHPLLSKWIGQVNALAARVGLELSGE